MQMQTQRSEAVCNTGGGECAPEFRECVLVCVCAREIRRARWYLTLPASGVAEEREKDFTGDDEETGISRAGIFAREIER